MNVIIKEALMKERKRIALELFKYSLYVDEIATVTRLSVKEINMLQELKQKEINDWIERVLPPKKE